MNERQCQITRRFGRVHYSPEDVIRVPGCIAPFSSATRFILLSRGDEDPFSWLQSLDDPALAFPLAPLELLFPRYAEQTAAKGRLRLVRKECARFYGIIVLDPEPANLTVNLLAPLALDLEQRVAEQVVMDAGLELARHPLTEALQALAEREPAPESECCAPPVG